MYCPCSSENVHEPVSPRNDCEALQKDQYIGGISNDTACYHYNIVDDLELKKIHNRSTDIMKMINTDMAEHVK
jgi:hypothetical protein